MPAYNVLKYEVGDFFLLYTGRKKCAALFCTKILKTKPMERDSSPLIPELSSLDFSLELKVSKGLFEKYFYSFIEMDRPFPSMESAIMNERVLRYVSKVSSTFIEGRSMTGESIETILGLKLWRDLLKELEFKDGMMKDGMYILVYFLKERDGPYLTGLFKNLRNLVGNGTLSLVSSVSMNVKDMEFSSSSYLIALGEEDDLQGLHGYLDEMGGFIVPAKSSELRRNFGKIISRGVVKEYSTRLDEKSLSAHLRPLILM
ncbi:MAG: hypothetical protein J7L50_03125 [Candidatus Odinarchaeota archaeon]|nr:hypothetical protein [Candidatus Odinarchaeota archaeon]